MRRFLLLGFILSFFCAHARAQVPIELLCPPGTTPLIGPAGQTFNPQTNFIRQNFCIDSNGHLIYQGDGGRPSGPTLVYAADFGVLADVKVATGTEVALVSGNKTITCTTCAFTSTDVGKSIQATNSFSDTGATWFSGAIILPRTTIASVTDSTHVVVNGTGPTASNSTTATLVWGSLTNTQLKNFWNAVAAITDQCATGVLQAGGIFVSTGNFNTMSAFCNKVFSPSFIEQAGNGLFGQGAGTTVFYPTTDFDFTTGAGNSCGGGVGNTTCFGAGVMQAHDWGFNGTFQAYDGGTHSVILFAPPAGLGNTFWHDISITNFLGGDTTAMGIQYSVGSFTRVYVQGVGNIGCNVVSNTQPSNLAYGACGNARQKTMQVTGTPALVNTNGMIYGQNHVAAPIVHILGAGTTWNSSGDFVYGGQPANTSDFQFDAGTISTLEGMNNGGASTFGLNVNGGTVFVGNSNIGAVTNFAILQASGKIWDMCGNRFPTGTFSFVSGSISGPCSNVGGNPWGTVTNCSSSAAPAVCGSAISGNVIIAAAATTVTVNTTGVTANSQISIQEDSSLGTKLGVTCNTATGRIYTITTRTGGTSFVITASAAPVTNPACLSYNITN